MGITTVRSGMCLQSHFTIPRGAGIALSAVRLAGKFSAVARILAVIVLSCKVTSPTSSASNEGLRRVNQATSHLAHPDEYGCWILLRCDGGLAFSYTAAYDYRHLTDRLRHRRFEPVV